MSAKCPGNAIFRAGGQLTPLGLLEEKKRLSRVQVKLFLQNFRMLRASPPDIIAIADF